MTEPALEQIPRLSRFVERTIAASRKDPAERLSELAEAIWTREEMHARIEAAQTSEALALELRAMRRDIVASLAVRDAAGRIDYFEVVRTMSDFAEEAVTAVVERSARELAERYGEPFGASGSPSDLLVVGMGKLGGRELNVSSDIDLVFVYGEDGETRPTERFPSARRSVSVQEFYERLARRVIPALNDVEGPGFVFRVDMRLRPNGDAGPIVCSSDMLEEYLYAQGRDWERFAWLKGRVVNGPVFATPEAFEADKKMLASLVRPFVFRKYLDFGAIASLTKLHELVRAETDRREQRRALEGVNVKLGRGGIREIEFITQTLQVIRGGRDARLRGRGTLEMLEALAAEGVIQLERAEQLREDYVFLRDVEHALQYVDDLQTQWLPREGEVLERAAGLLGLTPADLWHEIDRVREFVSGAFDSVFQVNEKKAETEDAWPVGWDTGTSTAREALSAKIASLGYDPAHIPEIETRLCGLVAGRAAQLLSEPARLRLRHLVEFVVERTPSLCEPGVSHVLPEELLSRYLRLLEAVAGRSTYVALLYQYPKSAERVGRVLASSRWCADYIVRHPIILDELVDGREKEMDDYTPVDWSDWEERLRAALAEAAGDQERRMNLLRDAHHAAVFRLLIADLDGRFSVERLSDQLSALADAVIRVVIDVAWESIPGTEGDRPDFAVVAYGKLGGKELGYQSDLDLVFLCGDDDPEAHARYGRLVRRMMSWLTVQTSSGKLFDVDLRLRPNGENGLAVCTFEAFSRYQRNLDGHGAWLWEHQALTRARCVAGEPALAQAFEREREAVLRLPREREAVLAGVLEMRRKMHEGHPNRSQAFDVKHDKGGMVDIEFCVQAIILMKASIHPELTNNFGNILLLEMAGRLGIVSEETARRAAAAYRRYRSLQHEIRLNVGDGVPARVPPEFVREEREAADALWREVFGQKSVAP